MAPVSDRAATSEVDESRADTGSRVAGLVVAIVFGGGLTAAARSGGVALLVAVAVVQAVLIVSWAVSVALPGARGSIAVAAAAAGASDFAVSYWPHGRLGTLLPVLGLAVPVMFAHQLARGAARVKLVASLSGVALIVTAVVALPALVQLRHEFAPASLGDHVAAAVAGAAAAGLVAGHLVDMVVPAPRFDPAVPRGALALLAAAVVGGSVSYLILRSEAEFVDGRAAFVGLASGVLAGLFAIAGSFVVHGLPPRATAWAPRLRPVVAVLLSLCILAPEAFLLCLAIRA